MKKQVLNTLLCIALLMGSLSSKAGIIMDKPSFKLEGDRKIGFQDSNTHSLWQKLKWDVGLGLSRSGPLGLSASTSLSFPIHKFVSIYASSGLVSLRGPSFDYHTEYYYNDGASYGYEINDYIIGDYLTHQLAVGLEIKEPFLNMFSLSVSPYYLRLLRSTSISHFSQFGKSGSGGSSGGGSGVNSNFVSIGGYNYGFPGINQNDYGVQFGLKLRYNRIGLSATQNIGFGDWGEDSYFGSVNETVSFTNVEFTYLIKK
jgi:hypothetical protein